MTVLTHAEILTIVLMFMAQFDKRLDCDEAKAPQIATVIHQSPERGELVTLYGVRALAREGFE